MLDLIVELSHVGVLAGAGALCKLHGRQKLVELGRAIFAPKNSPVQLASLEGTLSLGIVIANRIADGVRVGRRVLLVQRWRIETVIGAPEGGASVPPHSACQ